MKVYLVGWNFFLHFSQFSSIFDIASCPSVSVCIKMYCFLFSPSFFQSPPQLPLIKYTQRKLHVCVQEKQQISYVQMRMSDIIKTHTI